MNEFRIVSDYKPAGDQPEAIDALVRESAKGKRPGASGRYRFREDLYDGQRHRKGPLPTLVLAHNKTLAAQLCNEFKAFFPDSAVEYFVSYYDYYQPELTSPLPTRTLKKLPPSTTRSTSSATAPPAR
jgi:excinuclease ABC subunit B